jgi:hypothetical protein
MKAKALLLIPALAGLAFFSCKKEGKAPTTNGSPKLYKVTFRASSDFSTTINSAGKKQVNSLAVNADTVGIGSYTTVFHIRIVDSRNVSVRQILQNSNIESNYGSIVDSLPAGTYTVIMAAGQNGLQMVTGGGQTVLSYQGQTLLNGIWGDTFEKTFQLTVTNGPVNQNVVLNRIVAKLEADFTDAIPANASRVTMNINQDYFNYNVNGGQLAAPDTVTYSFPVPASAIGTKTFSISHVVLNTTTPFSVILTAYDSSNKVIATHLVTNVTCHDNQRTILTGNFSNQSGNTNPGFSITLDPNWGTPTVVHY